MHHHLGAEIRAADADVHHIANPLAGVTGPLAATHLVGKRRHLGAFGHDFGMEWRVRIARTQRGVQDGAAFRRIDDFAGEHRVAAFFDSGFTRHLHEQLEGFVGDAMLREIGRDTAAGKREAFGTGGSGIVRGGKPVAHVRIANLFVMGLQRGPGGERVQRHGIVRLT